MARKVKFPLELKDGYMARSNIEEIREHFDLEKIIAQFHNGRLKIWLDDHYLPEMAEQVGALDVKDKNLAKKLCKILGIEGVQTEGVDSQAIMEREARLQKLCQMTSNERYLRMAECAAFDQDELDNLLKQNTPEILLCSGAFRISLTAKNRTYYGLGQAVAVIDSDVSVDFDECGIRFVDVEFDEAYRKVQQKRAAVLACVTPDILAELCSIFILGNLKDGCRVLACCDPFWKDGFTYKVHPYVSITDASIRSGIAEGKETILGYGKAGNMFLSTKMIVFTDQTLYISDYQELLLKVRYSDIAGVIFASNSVDSAFEVKTLDGRSHSVQDAKRWDTLIGFFGVRLFLLVAARMFGKCPYEFTDSEKHILSQIHLDSLNDKYVTELI